MTAPRVGKKGRSTEARTRRALRKKERRKRLRAADDGVDPLAMAENAYLSGRLDNLTDDEIKLLEVIHGA